MTAYNIAIRHITNTKRTLIPIQHQSYDIFVPVRLFSSYIHYVLSNNNHPASISHSHHSSNSYPQSNHSTCIASSCNPRTRRARPSRSNKRPCPKTIAVRAHNPIAPHIAQRAANANSARRPQILHCWRHGNPSSWRHNCDRKCISLEICRARCIVGLAGAIRYHTGC
jgi:hypothetical protein